MPTVIWQTVPWHPQEWPSTNHPGPSRTTTSISHFEFLHKGCIIKIILLVVAPQHSGSSHNTQSYPEIRTDYSKNSVHKIAERSSLFVTFYMGTLRQTSVLKGKTPTVYSGFCWTVLALKTTQAVQILFLPPPPAVHELNCGPDNVIEQFVLCTCPLEEASYDSMLKVIAKWFQQLHLHTNDNKIHT